MSIVNISDPLVSINWLKDNFNAENLVVLDASMPKVTSPAYLDNREQVPTARFFNISSKFSELNAKFPNTYPSSSQFEKEARALGIHNNSAIVVYDDIGIYSSPRAWWLFKSFGHQNVAVLDGGIPEWKKANMPLTPITDYAGELGSFIAKKDSNFMKFFKDIQKVTPQSNIEIVDARSANRFSGLTPEPRQGLRSGTIPNSINLPFNEVLNNGKLKSKLELQATFSTLVKQDSQLVFSCGSGITACVLALAAEVAGYTNLAVYDGSWTEYGSLVL